MHLLLIEDDLDLGASLQQALRDAGFTSEWVRTARDGDQFAKLGHHDGVLLDLSLPDGHGFELLAAWRARGSKLPVLIITASDGLNERLRGLDQGADDFIVKPFDVAELISRIHAVMRRAAQQAAPVWRFGPLALDVGRRQVFMHDQPVELSMREYDLLLLLARSPGVVVTKDRLAQALEPTGEAVDFNALQVHVHNTRRKLGGDLIATVRGVGYLLRTPEPGSL